MPKGVYNRKKKLTKKQLKKSKRRSQRKYQQENHKASGVEDLRRAPTKGRDSYVVESGGEFSLNIIVNVGPRLAEERHGFNWRYWHNGND